MEKNRNQNGKLHQTKDILRRAVSVIVTLFLLFEIIVIALYTFGGEDAISNLPFYVMEISSDSMYPRLRAGDCVLVGDTEFEQVKVGDIITFFSGEDVIAHEVISVNENQTVTTKGLQNSYEDGQISRTYYTGKVLMTLPFMSMWMEATDRMSGKLIFMALVFVVLWGYPLGMHLLTAGDEKERPGVRESKNETEEL